MRPYGLHRGDEPAAWFDAETFLLRNRVYAYEWKKITRFRSGKKLKGKARMKAKKQLLKWRDEY